MRLPDVVRARLYGQAQLRTAAGDFAVSAPFVSAAAGAIVAAELSKPASRDVLGVSQRVDLDMSGYPTGVIGRAQRDASGRCLCHDPIRREMYGELWGP